MRLAHGERRRWRRYGRWRDAAAGRAWPGLAAFADQLAGSLATSRPQVSSGGSSLVFAPAGRGERRGPAAHASAAHASAEQRAV